VTATVLAFRAARGDADRQRGAAVSFRGSSRRPDLVRTEFAATFRYVQTYLSRSAVQKGVSIFLRPGPNNAGSV